MVTTATMKDSVANSGDGHTESGPPREMKRCSMKMCQTEYGKGIDSEGEGGARQRTRTSGTHLALGFPIA